MKYWEVKLKADRVGELLLYGLISNEQFWGDEVTPKQIDADLKALGELDELIIRINSGGGSVFAGMAIYSVIKRHNAPTKTAYIDGLAASMASVIPLAADRVIMPANALYVIHKPLAGFMGNADEFRQRADILDKIEGQAIDIYEAKTGLSREKIAKMLKAETWLTGKEALEFGFIDEVENDMQIAASIDGDFLVMGDARFNIAGYKNFNPEMYREAIKPPEPVANKNPDPPSQLAEQARDFNRLRDKIYKAYEEEK